MKKTSLAILVAMSALAGAAYAQESTEIKTITDPAKIAEIEHRAQALQQQQAAQAAEPAMHEEKHTRRKRLITIRPQRLRRRPPRPKQPASNRVGTAQSKAESG